MRYFGLATDYDGTIARDGRVDGPTVDALRRIRASGRKLIMVTGRELDDLLAIFPHCDLFDRVVAENGALIYHPDTAGVRVLTEPPSQRFIDELKKRGVHPLSVGRTICGSRPAAPTTAWANPCHDVDPDAVPWYVPAGTPPVTSRWTRSARSHVQVG